MIVARINQPTVLSVSFPEFPDDPIVETAWTSPSLDIYLPEGGVEGTPPPVTEATIIPTAVGSASVTVQATRQSGASVRKTFAVACVNWPVVDNTTGLVIQGDV